MNEHDIEAIKNLLNDAGIREGIDKYCIYIHAVVAQFVYSDKDGGGSFATYRDAWLSARASSCKKYLADIPTKQLRALFDMCEYVQDSNGIDFISKVSPELFPGDLKLLFDYMGPAKSRRSFIYNLIKLYGLYRYRNFLYSIEYLPYPRRFSDNEVLMFVKMLFDGWDEAGKYSALYEFSENITDLWLLAFGTPFVPRKVTSIGIAGVKRQLTDMGFSDDDILELFYICKTSHSFDLKHIEDPFSYFRKISLTRVDFGMRVAGDDFGKEISSPGESFYLKEEMFNKILKKWKSIDTVDFVRSVCFTAYSKNISAENALAMPYLYKYCTQEKHAIIFDANPDFILGVSESESDFAGKVLFVQSSRRLAMLYKQRFPHFDFAFLQNEGDSVPSIIQVDVEEHYVGKELRFIAQPVSEIYSMAIVFARREAEEQLGKVSNVLAEKIDGKSGPVFLFCPNSLLDTEDRSIRTVLADKYDYRWIQILPNATSSAWLKKNIIVCLTKKRGGFLEPLSLLKTDIYDNPSGGSELICQDPWPVKISQSQFIESRKTVNRLWEQFRAKPSKGKPRKAREWKFSKEISLWYSWSNKRGRVHYHSVPTEKQLAINPLQRGTRITPYYTYYAQSIEHAEAIFAEKIWESEFKPTIVDDINKAYKYRAITLKSFWFCNEDELRGKSGYNYDVAKKLFKSQQLSNLLSDGKYSFETYGSIIDDMLKHSSQKDQVNAWRTLNAIISLANQSGKFLPNTISDHVRSMVEKDRGYQQVRKNLAKRSYELGEENKILRLLGQKLPDDGAFVGAAISFYCGIVNRQVCALTWGDYQKLFGDEAGQLWITKTLSDNNEIKALGLDDKNMLRRVPVVRPLAKILDARLEFVKEKWRLENGDVSESEIKMLPIVSKEDLKSRCTPADIKAAKNQMESAADIESMEVSIAKIGAKVTDLNEYSGDRFRSNFLYRALQTCNMSRAEANYIYGISLPTTFSKHYCDYTSDFAQLMLCRKLERWTSLHQGKDCKVGVIEKKLPATGRQIRIDQNAYHRSAVELRLTIQREERSDDCGDLVVTINDDRGINLTIRKQEC